MLREKFLHYASVLTVGTLLFSAAILLLRYLVLEGTFLTWDQGLPVVLLFYFLGLWSGYRLLKAKDSGSSGFVRTFMLTSVIKLMGYFSVLFLFLRVYENHAPDIVFLFGGSYIVYAALERIYLLKTLRQP